MPFFNKDNTPPKPLTVGRVERSLTVVAEAIEATCAETSSGSAASTDLIVR